MSLWCFRTYNLLALPVYMVPSALFCRVTWILKDTMTVPFNLSLTEKPVSSMYQNTLYVRAIFSLEQLPS